MWFFSNIILISAKNGIMEALALLTVGAVLSERYCRNGEQEAAAYRLQTASGVRRRGDFKRVFPEGRGNPGQENRFGFRLLFYSPDRLEKEQLQRRTNRARATG